MCLETLTCCAGIGKGEKTKNVDSVQTYTRFKLKIYNCQFLFAWSFCTSKGSYTIDH